MVVKWNGVMSEERDLIGGTAQGSIFGIWSYLTSSNENAACVPEDCNYKFVDDLTVLEKVNLLVIGLASYNAHASVPSHIPDHNQFIPAEHLESQKYLNQIQEWSENNKMILNHQKTQLMIFNFTTKHQFTTNLKLQEHHLEVVKKAKLLGVIITDDLKWDENTAYLVKKGYSRLELLRKVAEITTSVSEMKLIYIQYIRSILEQSCVVWHSSLTEENSSDLERVQKCAIKIILRKPYASYEEALKCLNLESLEERRQKLCEKFALDCVRNEKMKTIFPKKDRKHHMKLRNSETFKVNFAKTKRLQQSSVVNMQQQLNSVMRTRKRNFG